jgi:hypothetical protein
MNIFDTFDIADLLLSGNTRSISNPLKMLYTLIPHPQNGLQQSRSKNRLQVQNGLFAACEPFFTGYAKFS